MSNDHLRLLTKTYWTNKHTAQRPLVKITKDVIKNKVNEWNRMQNQ